eukprot:c15551_g1_i1.p1 GENE.c15551_g1_i1~~c15551_g1_i1.p1  ORF type:complete len:132 (+),score=17.81 c15551_g1_i1:105-500(+)
MSDCVVNTLSESQILDTVSKMVIVDGVITNGAFNKPDHSVAYKIFHVPGSKQVKVLGHQVLWRYYHDFALIPPDTQVSHLCGRSVCGSAQCLVAENRDLNESRKGCHKGLWTLDWCPHASLGTPCVHHPDS